MSFNKEETEKIIKKLINENITNLVNSDEIITTICKKIHDPFNFAFGLDHIIASSYTRSFSSSLGTNIQGAVAEIAKIHGWNILNDFNNDGNIKIVGSYSDETRKIINEAMDYIDKSSAKDKIKLEKINNLKEEIIQSILNTEGNEKSINSDLILFKESLGYKEINIIELKTGGDLDKGKARIERLEMFEKYAVLVSKYKKEIINKTVKINMYFATIYNKDSMFSGCEFWKSSSVNKNFLKEELLIGKDFWNKICNDNNAFPEVISIFFEYSYIVENALKSLKDRVIPKLIEEIEKIKNPLIKMKYLEIINTNK